MSKLLRDDVLKLAELARLELNEEEVEKFRTEISEILGYVEKLQSVDINGLEPTYQVSGLKNVMRSDSGIKYEATPKELLKNVPEVEDGQIKVRRVL